MHWIIRILRDESFFDHRTFLDGGTPVLFVREGIGSWIPDRKVRKCSRKEMEKLWKRFWNAPLSIRVLDRTEATFVDGKNSIKVSVSDPVPDDFYPRLELE